MFEIVVLVIFIWLMFKAIGLAFRLTWGMAKIIASILMIIALPMLIICMIFVGGIILLIPIAIIGIVIAILKSSTKFI